MRSLPPLLALSLLALAGSSRADKAWGQWYWSTFDPEAAAPTTFDKADEFIIARNLWFHVQRFYAVLEPEGMAQHEAVPGANNADIPFSQNVAVGKLPFTSAAAHYRNIEAGVLRGTSLWVDFPYPTFPENMGHWAEVLLPIYSQLSDASWRQHANDSGDGTIQAVVFPNLRREQVQGLKWVMDMLKLCLQPGLTPAAASSAAADAAPGSADGAAAGGKGKGKAGSLPRMLFYDDLETLNATSWLGFERVLLVQNRYGLASGRSGFASPKHADAFREAAYAAANVTRSAAWSAGVAPPVITYLMAMNHEPVVNSGEVLAALHEVGDALGMAVRPYSVTPHAAFPSFVASMAKTGVLVARHGPLLANAIFLPPGAVVLELLPYNWEWQGISEVYRNLSASVGSVHHFAWKANSSEWVMYLEAEDAKYSHWTAEECSSQYCLEAHARAGMIVDTRRVGELLLDLLPHAMRGEGVAELAPRHPWPAPVANASAHTGLFWDSVS